MGCFLSVGGGACCRTRKDSSSRPLLSERTPPRSLHVKKHPKLTLTAEMLTVGSISRNSTIGERFQSDGVVMTVSALTAPQ